MNDPKRKSNGAGGSTKASILIVDDVPANLRLLAGILAKEGYLVRPVRDSRAAFSFASSLTKPPDLILLDINMPHLSGYEVCEQLKADERTRDIPVIFISALNEVLDKVKAFSVGGVDYINKPFHVEEVLARVETHLTLRKQQQSLKVKNEQLAGANSEITSLNQMLKEDNLRMSAELSVTRRLQKMILPTEEELTEIQGLDIAAYMEPADEVGGDYLDVLQYKGRVKITIGDVTGHGLESGVVMLMTQAAVRTLQTSEVDDPTRFLSILNRMIYDNLQRMQTDKSLTLSMLDYFPAAPARRKAGFINRAVGKLILSGQHEELIVVRQGGLIELVDTMDLGIPLGLEDDISDFIDQKIVTLRPGDGVVLYTDGITEAENMAGEQYGLERMCVLISRHWGQKAAGIKQAIMDDLHQYVGQQKIYDDITLLVLKQKNLYNRHH
ncbi:MAG: PP2C family protein-serine/threonine phosphatase [Ardenticatenaceae bacterium]